MERPERDLKILKDRFRGRTWQQISKKYGVSELYAKNCVEWLTRSATDRVMVEVARREFTNYKKAEKKRIKEDVAKLRKELNEHIRGVKKCTDKLVKVFS